MFLGCCRFESPVVAAASWCSQGLRDQGAAASWRSAAQDPEIQTPVLSTHHLASLTHWRQAPTTIRSCQLQLKLHQGNIRYTYISSMIYQLSHWHTKLQQCCFSVFRPQKYPPQAARGHETDVTMWVVSHLQSENCKFLLRNSFIFISWQ